VRVRLIAIALLAAATLGLGGMAATTGANAQPGSTPDTYVTYWDTVGTQAFTASGLAAPEGFVIFANVDIAVYDSLMAIRGGYQPFAVDVEAPAGASAEAAVAAAARDTLVHYLPAQAATIIDPAYVTSLATIPDGQAKTDGIATGQQVAATLIAQRADDGFRVDVPYTPPDPPIPGVWIPTSQAPPIGTYMQFMRPFSYDTPGQFRPAGPPALSSKSWARDYNEVKEIGSRTSTTRTADQTLAARFWAEPPVQQDHSSYRKFVVDHQLDVVEASRFMAMVSVASADAIIGCFEAKYHYAFWRPITAIRAGDTDGNDATVADPNWIHLLAATPNHPEYPSAHACATTAIATTLARYLGTDQIDFTVTSITGLGDRHFQKTKDLEYEAGYARIWGGIHYRTSIEDGTKLGMQTAHQLLAHHFHSTEG